MAKSYIEIKGAKEHNLKDISIEQRTTSKNPRFTVGTVTEIYDYLRLLFARVGQPHCYQCGLPVAHQTSSLILKHHLNMTWRSYPI